MSLFTLTNNMLSQPYLTKLNEAIPFYWKRHITRFDTFSYHFFLCTIWILWIYQFVGVLFWSCSVCYWLFSVHIKGNINSIMLPAQFATLDVQQCLPVHQMYGPFLVCQLPEREINYMHRWSEQAHQWVQHLVDMSHISQDRLITWSERPICFSKGLRNRH